MSIMDYILFVLAFYLWIGSVCAFALVANAPKYLKKKFRLTNDIDDVLFLPKIVGIFFTIVLMWPMVIWLEERKEREAQQIDHRVYDGIKNRHDAYRMMAEGKLNDYAGSYVAVKDSMVLASNDSFGQLFRDMERREDHLDIGIVYVRE